MRLQASRSMVEGTLNVCQQPNYFSGIASRRSVSIDSAGSLICPYSIDFRAKTGREDAHNLTRCKRLRAHSLHEAFRMMTCSVPEFDCDDCSTSMHVPCHVHVEVQGQQVRTEHSCEHGLTVRVLPSVAQQARTLSCPRCQANLLLAGTGHVDREGYNLGFVCPRCRLTLRKVVSRPLVSTKVR